jgi:phage baseplate assembly protein V
VTLSDLDKILRPLRTRIANMVSRARVTRVNDAPGIQELQLEVLAGEARDRCERFQQYGFGSHPKTDAEAVVLFVGGRRDHALVLVTEDRRYRLHLAEGEVAIFTDEGDRVHLKRGGVIHVKAATKVQVESPLEEVTGDLTAASLSTTDDVQDGVGTMAAIRSIYNSHTHPGGGVASPQMDTGGGGIPDEWEPLATLPADATPFLGKGGVCVRAGPGEPSYAYLAAITASGGAGWIPIGQSD